MDVKDFKAAEAYQDSARMGELLQQLDLNQPDKLVIEEQSSIPSLMQKYMTCQAETNAQLISFMGERITTPITINGDEISVLQQQHQLSTMASKSNLLTRQMEKMLTDHLKMQEGTAYDFKEVLINEPPMGNSFGLEAKASDTGLRMINTFSGDCEASNEEDLNTFLREIYSLTQTNNLTEQAAVSVIARKVSGSAQVLLDSFIAKLGGPAEVSVRQLVAHLE